MSAIDKIGLEVEGGWNGGKGVHPFPELPLIDDLSIDGTTLPTDNPLTTTHVGEIVSEPLKRDAVNAWLEKYWPHATNVTCGYHIHVSLKTPLHYFLLSKKTFVCHVLRTMEGVGHSEKLPRTHYLWGRLTGGNPFCHLSFDAAAQSQIREKRVGNRTRYGFLNFAQKIHGTVEFRALPTFENFKLAQVFTNAYLDCIEAYLAEESENVKPKSFHLMERDGMLIHGSGKLF